MEAEDLEVLPSVAIRRNDVKKSHCFIVQILSHCTGLQAQFSKIHLLVASNHKMLSMKNLLELINTKLHSKPCCYSYLFCCYVKCLL